ncbi:hypothetical protein PQC31_gp03 [Pseudomonas phage Iggy]|uniref:Uncharacterized protein n=1 Tax=Pseudomonas phage Iggy TaxID=2592193 RepID=A0A7S5AYU8_9CAUD|nr:hypothetical protein PQC31_gp03 [Pseudomonas phage Iggy]QEA09724.1 hypothetical protein [Pseudomonas phage Iggy]
MKQVCHKCGAINGGASKHRWLVHQGSKWCGHCGTKRKE